MTNRHPLPDAALRSHIAVLGKTGSGKTVTAKGIVERICYSDPGARVCVLDPIKSDWWGLTSSADGRHPGLPFHILGGPRGHVPLHESAGTAIGELVGTGALPLSIVDMADFGPGGLQHFFNDFAPALMRKARGVVYLVMEEGHEFAPKERAGIGNENMTVYFAKKLATAGRSKGIRLIVVTQRTQQLHNALLGSCETMIAHRLTLPADQAPVKGWLKGHLEKTAFDKVAGSLASLRTGTAWLCSGEAEIVEHVTFPPLRTFDNSATPDGSSQVDVITAPVDRERLRAIMGEAVKEAEENDVPMLKAEIARLKAELAKKPAAAVEPDPKRLEVEFQQGVAEGRRHTQQAWQLSVARLRNVADGIVPAIEAEAIKASQFAPAEPTRTPGIVHRQQPFTPKPQREPPGTPPSGANARPPSTSGERGAVRDGLTGPEQRILDALAWWKSVGVDRPSRLQVAIAARYSTNTAAFKNPLGALNTRGLLCYPTPGFVEFAGQGESKANHPETPPTTAELHTRIMGILDGPRCKILQPLLDSYPSSMSREDLASAANYSTNTAAFKNPLGSLRSLGLIDYPQPGQVVALPILFVE